MGKRAKWPVSIIQILTSKEVVTLQTVVFKLLTPSKNCYIMTQNQSEIQTIMNHYLTCIFREGHVDTTRLLLNKGAEINTPSGSNDDTPLTLACWKGI